MAGSLCTGPQPDLGGAEMLPGRSHAWCQWTWRSLEAASSLTVHIHLTALTIWDVVRAVGILGAL